MKILSICRICLSTSAPKEIAKLGPQGSNKTGSEMFTFCFNIQIENDSKISTKLCLKCFRKILMLYNFKLLALKNDTHLRTLELNMHIKNEENIDKNRITKQPENSVQEVAESVEVELELVKSGIEESDDELLSDIKKIKHERISVENNNDSVGNEQLETHTKKEDKAKKSKKQICEECGKSVVDLKTHMKSHEPEKAGTKVPCTLCNKTFSAPIYRSRHMKRTHLTAKKPCPICNKVVRNLYDHMCRLHDPAKLPFGCYVCNKRFATSRDLNVHMVTHTKERPFHCEICDKRFSRNQSLREHMQQIHERKVPFVCQFCSKSFFTKIYLQRHLKSHTAERAYKCDHCDKAFKTSNDLKHHTYTHSEEKAFRCTECDISFAHPGYLRAHARTHTRDKQYPCKYCDAKFHRSDHRKRHEFTAHEKHLITK